MGHSIFDELLVATDDEDVPVGVVVALVARMNPAVDNRLGSFLGI